MNSTFVARRSVGSAARQFISETRVTAASCDCKFIATGALRSFNFSVRMQSALLFANCLEKLFNKTSFLEPKKMNRKRFVKFRTVRAIFNSYSVATPVPLLKCKSYGHNPNGSRANLFESVRFRLLSGQIVSPSLQAGQLNSFAGKTFTVQRLYCKSEYLENA